MKMRALEKFWRPNMSKIEYNDLIGKTFGFLTIKEITKNKTPKQAICKCLCGNTCTRGMYDLIKTKNKIGSHPAQCGQCYNGIPLKNFIGKKYGYLTIIDFVKDIKPLKAICKCSCGNKCERVFTDLQRNSRKSKKLQFSQCGECFQGIPLKNFIGKRLGTFKILNIKKSSGRTMIVCKCDCGIIKETRIQSLKKLKIRCGNCYNGIPYKNYIGKTFGYLTITNIYTEKEHRYASCTCQCGNKTKQAFFSLLNNKILSCGCLKSKREALKKISFGSLNIVGTSNNNIGGLRYVCRCTCGNEIEVLESDLFTGKVTCCEECKK